MTPRIVTFGEIMLRLSPPGHLRFGQARSFEAIYGGGEANVAASLVNFGLPADFVTRLPTNDLGEACLQYLRACGVGTELILRGGDRLGIYFLENGAAQRGSKVMYDRAGSAFATLQPGMIDWVKILKGATWFHWTGITPAVSEGAAAVCLEGVRAARALGLTVSCDLNYRAKLWKGGKPAGEVMAELMTSCDLAVANEEDADKFFGIRAPDTDVTSGRLDPEKYRSVCEQLARRFPHLETIAITLRGSLSAGHNTWSAVLWKQDQFHSGPTYDLPDIVDRVGAGDAFSAGLIYALNRFGGDPQRALAFAIAASALKHSIFGDFNLVTVAEVEALMTGNASGRVSR
ncbi:MAG TPA: sugar kinase [Anaerolineales bacterium]